MPTPAPPVPLKDHCSIIYNNVLYVYSPDAFQVLSLTNGSEWKQEKNGVSVTGAVCVKGGMDGDSTKPALYVIGGVAKSSSAQYAGLQRYSIDDQAWTTITPIVPITQNRVNHGAAYMNASSAVVVYAGSQNGNPGASTETFLIELYEPYRVQAYSSIAPPTVDPVILTYSDDKAVMVGGSSTNVEVFTFHPATSWVNLGVALTTALPSQADAQCALLTLDDGSKILETFYLNQSPNLVTRDVLLTSGGAVAPNGETVGSPTSSSATSVSTSGSSRKRKRQTALNSYPIYNATDAPTTTRTGFSLAQDGNGLVTIVGGDSADSLAIFNQTGNGWLNAAQVLGDQSQTPLASSSTQSVLTSATSTSLPSSSPTSGANTSHGQSHSLTILGAVLGAICGLAAVLLIMLLWLRSVRRKRRFAEKNERRRSEYRNDQKLDKASFEDQGLQPLSHQGKPMGRSPVPSNVPSDSELAAAMVGKQHTEKQLEERLGGVRLKLDPHIGEGMGFGAGMWNSNKPRDKNSLLISRPFAPDLGHYLDRPSIELGRATPAETAPTAAMPMRNISQRKTDEGWGKYFAGGAIAAGSAAAAAAYPKDIEPKTTWTPDSSRPSSTRSKGAGGFWPGPGVGPEKTPKSPNLRLRDSNGQALNTRTVAGGSPSMSNGPADQDSRYLGVAQGVPARISNGDTLSTVGSDADLDDDLEDESVIDDDEHHAYSSGIPSSVPDAWTPVGNTWSGPPQRPLRPPSSPNTAYPHAFFPPPTNVSEGTSHSNGTKRSSIPSFPMPSSTIRHVKKLSQDNNTRSAVNTSKPPATTFFAPTTAPGPPPTRPPRPAEDMTDYFNPGPGRDGLPNSSDMSWLNLGAENRR